jgi:hypothetical protein
MPNATVRANARALPETIPHPDADLRALAAQFEAAFQAHRPFFYGSGTDEEAEASTRRVDEIARKIVALPTTDIEMMRLKARIYLWSEATDFETFAAKNENDGSSEAVLVSLFRDLSGVDLDAALGPATMVDRAPAQDEANREILVLAAEFHELRAKTSLIRTALEPLEVAFAARTKANGYKKGPSVSILDVERRAFRALPTRNQSRR